MHSQIFVCPLLPLQSTSIVLVIMQLRSILLLSLLLCLLLLGVNGYVAVIDRHMQRYDYQSVRQMYETL